MSFALAPQSKNKGSNNKTATPVKRSSYVSGVSSMAMTPQDSILKLQQTIGNQAVQRIMRSKARNNGIKTGIQTKLKISQPGDVYEQEADRVAEQVMRMSSPKEITTSTLTNKEKRIDRKCGTCEMKKEREEEENLNIRRKPSATSNFETGNEVTNKISNIRSSGGSALDANTREFMELSFGKYDFSKVRIHTDESERGRLNQ